MSKSQETISVLCLTPAAYQVKHKHEDAMTILAAHCPKVKVCKCGAKIASDTEWSEHVATLLFPLPATMVTTT